MLSLSSWGKRWVCTVRNIITKQDVRNQHEGLNCTRIMYMAKDIVMLHYCYLGVHVHM